MNMENDAVINNNTRINMGADWYGSVGWNIAPYMERLWV